MDVDLLMREFFETREQVGKVPDWREFPELGEEDEEDDELRDLGGPGSGNFGHQGGVGGPGNPGGSSKSGVSQLQAELGVPIRKITDKEVKEIVARDPKLANELGVGGFYDPETREIAVQDGITQDVLAHELGHALDNKLGGYDGWYSDSANFSQAWRADTKELDAWGRREPEYRKSRKEVFADAIAHITAGRSALHNSADFPKRYARSIDHVRGVLERRTSIKTLGGPGSGNFGHSGRPGLIGGSATKYPTGLTKIGGPLGSNKGGVFKDSSGQKWYLKEYKQAAQAANEQLANDIYRAVGVAVPDTALSPDGSTIASKWVEGADGTLGERGLTQSRSDQILDGFVADVFVANWDAVGTGHDNILIKKDGSISRVDQGGSLLYRAQGGLKPREALHSVGEWDTLISKNDYYRRVFNSAGVKDGDALGKRAVDQIDRIIDARPSGGWINFVERSIPSTSPSLKKQLAEILERRQEGLEGKRQELLVKTLGGPGSGNFGHSGRPGQVGGSSPTFHGTSVAAAQAIKQEGLRPNRAGRLFVAKDVQLALEYALTASSKDVVAVVVLEARAARFFGEGQIHDPGVVAPEHETFFEGRKHVPAEFIKEVRLYTRKDIEAERVDKYRVLAERVELEDDDLLLVLTDELTALGGPGSGNFGHSGRPGQVGGSTKKQKHTLEQIAKAWEMKQAGATMSQIQKATTLHPSTQYYYTQKIKKKEEAISVKLSEPTPPPPSTGVLGSKFDPVTGSKISEAPTLPTGALAVKAQEYGYEWKEKTTGPQKGKYAYFQNGIQVSAPFLKEETEKAAASMHFGTGPKAPPTVSPAPSGWPIGNEVERKMGKTTPKLLQKDTEEWATHLSATEKEAISSYTGSAYGSINSALWKGTHPEKAKTISSALDKAPKPPPPDLVWRGIGSHGAAALLPKMTPGAVVELTGFQSTSINPAFAANWGGGALFEIRPKKGAYVRPLSYHKSEYEYLLPHGQKYTVHGVSYIKMEGKSQPVRVVQLEMQ